MKALIQRVKSASVTVEGEVISEIGHGLLILLGVARTDTEQDVTFLAGKTARLRVFADEAGKMNRSVTDVHGAAIVVSQFTLYGDTSRGNRPGFDQAALPEPAERLYRLFIQELSALGVAVQSGRFGADMQVSLQNDGPVTLMLESRQSGGRI